MATHRVIAYSTLLTGRGISRSFRFLALKQGIKGLINRGRLVIEASYAEAVNPISGFQVGRYYFETIYLGRKAIKRRGIRHRIRNAHKKGTRTEYFLKIGSYFT